MADFVNTSTCAIVLSANETGATRLKRRHFLHAGGLVFTLSTGGA